MPSLNLESEQTAAPLAEISQWMSDRINEAPADLHVPALLEGHRLLEELVEVFPAFAAARARNEDAVFKLLTLNEKTLLSRRWSSAQLRAWLAAERRLSITSVLLELAPLVRRHALRLATVASDEPRWALLLIAANARHLHETLEVELQTLLAARAQHRGSPASLAF